MHPVWGKNIQNITVQELTALVDLNRATFYLHYKDIYDLQEQIESQFIENVKEFLGTYQPEGPNGSAVGIFLVILRHMKQNEKISRMLLSENSSRTFKDRLSQLVEDFSMQRIEQVVSPGMSQDKKEYAVSFIVAGHVAMMERWFSKGMQEPEEEIAAVMGSITEYFRGFRPKASV